MNLAGVLSVLEESGIEVLSYRVAFNDSNESKICYEMALGSGLTLLAERLTLVGESWKFLLRSGSVVGPSVWPVSWHYMFWPSDWPGVNYNLADKYSSDIFDNGFIKFESLDDVSNVIKRMLA